MNTFAFFPQYSFFFLAPNTIIFLYFYSQLILGGTGVTEQYCKLLTCHAMREKLPENYFCLIV